MCSTPSLTSPMPRERLVWSKSNKAARVTTQQIRVKGKWETSPCFFSALKSLPLGSSIFPFLSFSSLQGPSFHPWHFLRKFTKSPSDDCHDLYSASIESLRSWDNSFIYWLERSLTLLLISFHFRTTLSAHRTLWDRQEDREQRN